MVHAQKEGNRQSQYPRESAGRLATREVPCLSTDARLGDIQKLLRLRAREYDSINYIYLLDSARVLRGVASVKEILSGDETLRVKDIMTTALTVVRPYTDRERVAHIALEHNIKAVPVVDKDGVFAGAVMSDTILDILHEEHGEDIARLAGLSHHGKPVSILTEPLVQNFLHRFPWLLVGLGGGVLLAKIIGFFDDALARNALVVAFLPLVVYMSGATGTQMSMVVVRDLVVEQRIRIARYILRHALVVGAITVCSALILYVAAIFFFADTFVSGVLALALIATMLSSLFSGLGIPFTLHKLGLDPANGSGPFGTIVQDILSAVIYFTVISFLL